MNKREQEITPEMARMSPKEVANLLAVSEERARELLAQAKGRAAGAKPGRKRRPADQTRPDLGNRRITFYGPL